MQTLEDKLRPYAVELIEAANAGDAKAKQVISLHRMHVSCPSDPGAPALCEEAFKDWLKTRK